MPALSTDREHSSEAPVRRSSWIASRRFDLVFFTLSPSIGIALVLITWFSAYGSKAAALVTFFLAFPHYLSSFSFFFADENRSYFQSRWLVYYLGPALILVAVCGLRVFQQPNIVAAVLITWNIYHVSRQSAGILTLYRRLNGGRAQEKLWADQLILFLNAGMAFWFLERTFAVHDIANAIHYTVPSFIRVTCVCMALYCGWRYFNEIRRRENPLSFAEKAFLSSSLLLFHPFLWVEDIGLATLAMLSGHFVQYLCLTWLLNRRKYAADPGQSWQQRGLSMISGSTVAVLGLMIFIGAVFYFFDKGAQLSGMTAPYWILVNSIALIHFYIDGLVWAFRNPHVRKSIGPFLIDKTSAATR